MKRLILLSFLPLIIGAGVLPAVAQPLPTEPITSVIPEEDLQSIENEPPSPTLEGPAPCTKASPPQATPEEKGDAQSNDTFRIRAGPNSQAIAPGDKETEAERFLRENQKPFQGRDDHGAILFSFSREGVDLKARGSEGEEGCDPVDHPSEK